MFYTIKVHDKVRLPPNLFSLKIEDGLTQVLREKYERRIDKEAGVILAVWNTQVEGGGLVIAGDSGAYYSVSFDALAYMPQINEVVEAEVTEIVEFGAFVGLGPIEGLIHLSQIANDFLTFNKKIPNFTGKESKKALGKGDQVLAKISTVSLKPILSETKIGLTMRPEGLGKAEWVELSERRKGAKDEGERPKEKRKAKETEAKAG